MEMRMNKNNVLLIEKQDVNQNEIIKDKEGKINKVSGFKLFRVIKPTEDGFDVIAQYDHNEDKINLSILKDYKDFFLCSVDRDAYNNEVFVWNCAVLKQGSEDNEVFIIEDNRECTKEEVELLNEVFPEYYDNAF